MDKRITDPMERKIACALDAAGLRYVSDMQGNPSGLDFALSNGVEIEVKRFHTPRIAEQMARAENVIAIQGAEAVRFFAALLHRLHPKLPQSGGIASISTNRRDPV